MKITDEMVERAYQELPQGPLYVEDVRFLLEAALAGVPEPEDVYDEWLNERDKAALLLQDFTGADADRRTLSGRVAVLEAKLAKVRERAEDIGLNEEDMAYLLGDK